MAQTADLAENPGHLPRGLVPARGGDHRAPRLGCAVVVERDGEILLGVRAKDPFRGKWVLPGGGVKFLESYRSTAQREIREEVGIDIEVDAVLDLYEIVNPPDEHRIIIYCRARYVRGDVKASSDLSDARFFSRGEIRSLISAKAVTPTVERVLREHDLT